MASFRSFVDPHKFGDLVLLDEIHMLDSIGLYASLKHSGDRLAGDVQSLLTDEENIAQSNQIESM